MKIFPRDILITALILMCLAGDAWAKEEDEKAEQSYNKAIDLYNKLDYNKAVENFLKAFNTANSKLEQWTNYNLGNVHFEKAQKAQKVNDPTAAQDYKNALDFFRRAIELNPDDQNAKYNHELTALKLKELQEQQQQKQQQDEQQKQQQGEQSKQQQEDKSDNQQNDQQQDEQQKQQQGEQQNESQDKDKEQSQQQGSNSQQEQARNQEMTKEQALMLLDNFKRSEDRPTALRRFSPDNQSDQVDKDW